MKAFKFCALLFLTTFYSCNQPYNEGFEADVLNPPNIIIILADDLGWGDLACYGNPIIKTPNLDLLASSGIRFTQCHSASRADLLTGKSPYRIGFFELQYEDV